jgi:hypothetical protein
MEDEDKIAKRKILEIKAIMGASHPIKPLNSNDEYITTYLIDTVYLDVYKRPLTDINGYVFIIVRAKKEFQIFDDFNAVEKFVLGYINELLDIKF